MDTLEKKQPIGFWELISTSNKIEIPIIQRDFAQGRTDDKTNKIRNIFLNDLIHAIDTNSTLELDFVYGSTSNIGNFNPLDGQQRLTTLFLLHWFIAIKTERLNDVKHILERFTYETRISSREFCQALVNQGDFLGHGNSISSKICDAEWFYLSWKKDPTISGMLIMLDDIEKLLESKTDQLSTYWDRLTSEKAPIVFYQKQLKNIGLTDDLYIKMNARGKTLTDFENFKARFQKYVKGNNPSGADWEKGELDFTESFSHKLDTVWTDLFWKYKDGKHLLDKQFMKFIAGIAINHYAFSLEVTEKEDILLTIEKELENKNARKPTKEAIKRELVERKITKLFNSPLDVSPEDFPNKSSFEYLKESFDVYAKYNHLIKLYDLPLWDLLYKESRGENFFSCLITSNQAEYKQRVLFYAQTTYLATENNFDLSAFLDWMRVIRNIVLNSTIASSFIGAMNLVKQLSEGCSDIYTYLSDHLTLFSDFASIQIQEEIIKAKIIIKGIATKKVIHLAEDTNFLKGRIAFALYCIEVKSTESPFNENLFKSLIEQINLHLGGDKISNEFRRGLLTTKDHKFYTYWKSESHTTNTLKRRLVLDTAELKRFFLIGEYKDYLKELLLLLAQGKTLQQVIDEFVPSNNIKNWELRLIKEPNLLDNYAKSKYFGVPDDKSYCLLFKKWIRPNSRNECKKVI